MFLPIVESGCYIDINVSEIYQGSCGKAYCAHAEHHFNPNWTGFFKNYLQFGGHPLPLPFLLLVNQ